MFKSNLNRQFQTLPERIFAILKMSLFGIGCNLVFHSLILTLLVYWSFTSRQGNFNQFWTENQLLLATLCQGAIVMFFRESIAEVIRFTPNARNTFFSFFLKGTVFGSLICAGLVLSKQYDFLGFTAQTNLTFFSSYAWVLRAFILLIFVTCTGLFIYGVVVPRLPSYLPEAGKKTVAALTLLAIYAVWFELTIGESLTLLLLCLLMDTFWESLGFLSALFILTHAVLSLPWMGTEFSGLAQLKSVEFEARFYESPTLQLVLFLILVAFKGIPFYSKWRSNK